MSYYHFFKHLNSLMEFLNGCCSFFVVISGSGATAYVEPAAAVPLNNKLSEARADVLKAEYEVLSKLTDKVTKLVVHALGSWFIVDLPMRCCFGTLITYYHISVLVCGSKVQFGVIALIQF